MQLCMRPLCSLLCLVGALAATSIAYDVAASVGRCPDVRADAARMCLDQCSSDVDCPGRHHRCCPNGCGHVCLESAAGGTAASEAPGAPSQPAPSPTSRLRCPPAEAGALGVCAEECLSDAQCPDGRMCCSNGCGHACADPVTSGGRPPPPTPRGINGCPPATAGNGTECRDDCSAHADCDGSRMCCHNGCGYVCVDGDTDAATEQAIGCRVGENFYLEGDIMDMSGVECMKCHCSSGEVKCTASCRAQVSLLDKIKLVVFSTVGLTMTVFLILLLAKCFVYRQDPRDCKLKHEVPGFLPVPNPANGHIL